ncbi:AAA family ATPase [Kitasatospora sp. NPDC049285]|uniref:helix-turn-helix transcriptional regulator n=1 Tax=Kitasatospora sp. NPDC049285 TaxID=3157096 RepID=UPI0034183D9B
MEQISVSPVFVGRGRETGLLTAALRRAEAGEPQALLVGGEAGVGKTRLVEEFLDRACGPRVATTLGACLEVGAEGLPYGPLAGALRRLHRQLGPELERAAAGMEGHLARLLPDFGEADGAPNDEYGRARLFEHTARLFERLSTERTLVLAIEDLHWSDRSTRELLAYLIRTLHRSRVLIVATYRTDDLHRRHPLRPFLAELERLRSVQRLELERLDRPEVAAQLAGILGTDTLDRELVERIHRRSEGNPFFVEELATAHQNGCLTGLTEPLRDILLVRVEALPDDAQRIVRIAAEGGSRIEHALLAAVAVDGQAVPGEDALIAALRTAVGANILRPDTDGEGYRFRHALVREAVSDDLLPGERHGINRRFATALEADPELVDAEVRAARLANYWYHAHHPARALPTALDAARAARRRNAFAEQLKMLERALELWDSVSAEVLATTLRPYDWADTYPPCACDPGEHDGCDRLQIVDVLAEAVVAARRASDRDRGQSLARRALALVDERSNPARAAWFRLQRARMLGHLQRPGGIDEIQYAHRLLADLGPSAIQAEALALDAAHGMLRTPVPELIATAERAVEIAREVGATSVEVHARTTLAGLLGDFGQGERAVAMLTEALDRSGQLGDVYLRGLNNLASLLLSLGRAEEAVTAARNGLDTARGNGLLLNSGPILTGNLAEALLATGRTAEAAGVLGDWEQHAGDVHRDYLDRLRGQLALLRGESAEAERYWSAARCSSADGDQPQHALPTAQLGLQIAAAQGRIDLARERLAAVLDGVTPAGKQALLLPLLAHAAGAEADLRHLPAAADGRAAVLARIAARAADLTAYEPLDRGWAALLDGELARAEGRPGAAHWERAITELRATALPHPLDLALLRAAEEQAATDREAAAELLRESAVLARERADQPLARQAELLAGRLGLALDAPRRTTADEAGFGLTPRERDVLGLLALGRTNRQIAEQLFISPKTASVHVSNILAKLAVSSRGEAAALAHRLRLLPEAEPALG